jgi:hypothetical protein
MLVNPLDTQERTSGRRCFEYFVAPNAFCQVSGRNDTTFTNPVTPQGKC